MKPLMLLGVVLTVIGALALVYHGIIKASVEKQTTLPLAPLLGARAVAFAARVNLLVVTNKRS